MSGSEYKSERKPIVSGGGALLLSLLVLAACGGGETKADLGDVSANDLPLMVLPTKEFGSLLDGLDEQKDSGTWDAAKVAHDSLDPNDSAGDIRADGYEIGYERGFSDADLSNFKAGSGVTATSSMVALFNSPKAAREFVVRHEDRKRFEGMEIGEGVKVSAVETRELKNLGDEARLGEFTLSVEGQELRVTELVFSLDRIFAVAVIARADRADTTSEVKHLAASLERRIREVAAG